MELQHEQDLERQTREDVELVARQLARLTRQVDKRFEGIRSDFEVALLEEVGKLVRRMERLEGLIVEHLGSELAESLLAHLG